MNVTGSEGCGLLEQSRLQTSHTGEGKLLDTDMKW